MTFSLLLGAFHALNFGIGGAYPSEGNSYGRPFWSTFWWEGSLGREWTAWVRFHHYDAYTWGVDTVEGEELGGDLTETIVCYQLGVSRTFKTEGNFYAAFALGFSGNFYSAQEHFYSRNRKVTQSTPGPVVRARVSRRKLYSSRMGDWSVVLEVGAEADFLYAGTREVWPGPGWLGGLGVFVGARW